MNQFRKLFSGAWSILVVCTLAFAMAGCEGDDGAQGPTGPQGPVGDTGPAGADGDNASVLPLESCGVCHSDGSFASAPAAHALDPIESVRNVEFEVVGADLVVTFDILVDGVLTAGYNNPQRGYRTDGVTRTTITDSLTLEDNGGGSYTLTVAGGAAQEAINNRYMFRVFIGENTDADSYGPTRVYFYGDFPASPFGPTVVSAASCTNCHGPEGIQVHGGPFQEEDGIEPCLVCHGVDDVPSVAQVAHGYHSGIATWEDPQEAIEITYPTYMANCSVCHSQDDIVVGELTQLAAANAMPVSGPGCLSCHGSMDNALWDFSGGLNFHLTLDDPLTHDCATQCHEVGGAATNYVAVTDFHNGATTDRGGIIFAGVDTAVEEGKRFDWTINDIDDNGETLAISWSASYDGVGVDPCNADIAGGPLFFVGNTVRAYRSYAQGGDFILGQDAGGSPGEPASVTLDATNTVCLEGTATTTIPVDVVDATIGRVWFSGKPLVLSDLIEPATQVAARVPAPTYDWSVGDGLMVERRAVVETEKCLGCHVGSLYQHGGDRVDNVDACLMCHNEAANEQDVRVGMGVDASEAYDGRVGENYGMKTMLHRVHSANYDWNPERGIEEYNPPYLVYRGRGIYAFAGEGEFPPNWDAGAFCGDPADPSDANKRIVFGSDDNCQPHNFEAPTYPRSLNECTACHDADFMVIPDQAESMAATVEAGMAPWNNQLDDVLQGAGTTACVTCHASSATKGHAYQNSWVPQEFPEGRETIIDAGN